VQTSPAIVMEWVVVAFIALVALIVLYKMFIGNIDLSSVLNEMTPHAPPAAAGAPPPPPPTPKASLSRLQLLLFTFVIVGLYLTLCLEAGQLLEIPNQVLGLLGISGGSYVVSKGIQANANS
jgi:hypothetical protein